MKDIDILYQVLNQHKNNINKPILWHVLYITENLREYEFHYYINSESGLRLVSIRIYLGNDEINFQELNKRLGWKLIDEVWEEK
jgi:hypothetical protein